MKVTRYCRFCHHWNCICKDGTKFNKDCTCDEITPIDPHCVLHGNPPTSQSEEGGKIKSMTETIKIDCDNCGNDLSDTSNCMDYRVIIDSEEIHSISGAVTLMYIPRPVSKKHFCNMKCTREWISNSHL